MKYGRELERNIISEWKPKYFDYKAAKKIIKQIRHDEESTPSPPSQDEYSVFGSSQMKHNQSNEATDRSPDSGADNSRLNTSCSCALRYNAVVTFLQHEFQKVNKFYQDRMRQAQTGLTLVEQQFEEMMRRKVQHPDTRSSRVDELPCHQTFVVDDEPSCQIPRGRPELRATIHNKTILRRLNSITPWTLHGFRSRKGGIRPRHAHDDALRGTLQSRDYVRTHQLYGNSVGSSAQRIAELKLKLALRELYRSVGLLKSYAVSNRTAFHKVFKKLKKAAAADGHHESMHNDPTWGDYVHNHHFTTLIGDMDRLDSLSRRIVDLYAKYYTDGDRKAATDSLRDTALSQIQTAASSGSGFCGGLLFGIGIVLMLHGIIRGSKTLLLQNHQDQQPNAPVAASRIASMLQLYAGILLIIWVGFLFCINCCLWTAFKINYRFILELDPRSQLSWQQMMEFLSIFVFLLGLGFWIAMFDIGPSYLELWYPLMLVGVFLLLLGLPLPIFRPKTRRWLWTSHARLALAGFFPVEFRDILLGDIYCSLAYVTSNIELFFCLYVHRWADPVSCNSGRSRLMGFFSTLPSLWRSAQCVRRYSDTGLVFPHLINLGKYVCTILAYLTLSLYRIDGSSRCLAALIVFNFTNAVYCAIWDLTMDFGLLQRQSTHKLLRNTLAVPGDKSYYYCAMVVDVILRFAWIFYAIFTHGQAQHSSLASFAVAFAEASRRGMWIFFRVENEHCVNIELSRVSREMPLPYDL